MPITVDATYENGTLKLAEPLPLKEHEKVRVTVQPEQSRLLACYGIMGFTGSAELAEYYAMDPEIEYSETEEEMEDSGTS